MFRDSLLLALLGAMGTLCRHFLSVWIAARWPVEFPLATFAVNVSGAFLLGMLVAARGSVFPLSNAERGLLAAGFVGAYTTFGSLLYDSLQMWQGGHHIAAVLNVLGNFVAGLAALLAGAAIGRGLPV